MLKVYAPRDGVLVEVPSGRYSDGVWIDLVSPSPDEVDALHKEFGIALQDIADCLDPNERARVEIEENYDLVVLRGTLSSDADGGERIQIMPVGIVLTPQKIVTIRLVETFKASELTADLKKKPRIESKEDVFLAIVRRIIRDIDRKVRPFERNIGAIQEKILMAHGPDVSETAFQMSNNLVLLNTALLSNLNALSLLPKAKQMRMTKEKLDLADDLENDIGQLYEMTTIYREIMDNVLNAYELQTANNLAIVMKTLTTISLILILPTLIASLYGMNLSLPFAEHDYAFFIVISISAISVGVLWVIFRLKRIL